MWLKLKTGGLIMLLLAACVFAFSCSKNAADSDVVDDDDSDNIPPAAITDLTQIAITTNSVTLQWTAPGDDGMDGVAYEYDLRASYDTITPANFAAAFHIDSIYPPLPAGMTQTCEVDSLTPGQKYYFAIKTRDNIGNWSPISNCLSAICLADLLVTFPDTALDRIVRETVNKPIGDLHMSDLQDLTDLFGEQVGIEDLSGLEYCIGLQWLILPWNNISDLTPLQGLTKMLTINLISNNVSDLAPLTNLVNLRQLHLGENPCSDITPLQNMIYLEWLRLNSTQVRDFSPIYGLSSLLELDLGNNALGDISFVTNFTSLEALTLNANGITDITPLGSLTNLEYLNLAYNQISDISTLSGLINIQSLALLSNQITDILPLVNNTGLGAGDVVHLQNNPLSVQSIDVYIPALEQRGVTVNR